MPALTTHRRVAVLLTLVLPLAGCTTNAPAAARWAEAARAGASAHWTPCPDAPKQLYGREIPNVAFDCATLAVPKDWAKPAETFSVALIRGRVAGQRDRIGSLLLNPGGPGGSGFDFGIYFAGSAPVDVLRRFDVIGFDPRGVGRSSPVTCVSDTDKDATIGLEPDPATQEQFDKTVALTRKMAEGCGQKYGASLRLFSTAQTARDMEAIRLAVGGGKLTYLGYSYGTLLGAVYAHQHPTDIRAMVLDGTVDPQQDPVAASEGQAVGFERAFGNFAAWCASAGSTCGIGPDARATVADLLAAARAQPATVAGRAATSGWVFLSVVASMYDKDQWPVLADALADLGAGKPAKVFKLADRYYERDPSGHYGNILDANSAINCADATARPDLARIRALQSAWRTKYPLFGANMAIGLLTCTLWPAAPDPYEAGPAAGSPPLLVVGTKGDPATPYEQTARLAALLGTGRVLTSEGEGHTAYPGTACITEAVNHYLVDLVPPPADTTCPAK